MLFMLLPGCTGIQEGLVAVEKIDTERYLGKWHEIARPEENEGHFPWENEGHFPYLEFPVEI